MSRTPWSRPLALTLTEAGRLSGRLGLRLLQLVLAGPLWLMAGLEELGAELLTAISWQSRLLGLLVLLGFAGLPAWAGAPLVVAAAGVLWLVYVGQAWNLLSGFAGPLSLGAALFIGLGAWLGVWLGPWLGLPVTAALAMALAALLGLAIGAIGFRDGRNGLTFSLLTLILAEAGRLFCLSRGGFPGGGAPGSVDVTSIRAGLFYYLILAMVLSLLVLSRQLQRSALGLRWLAVREQPVTAATVGIDVTRTRLSAAALSAAFLAPAGVVLVWSGRALIPDQLFSLTLSLKIALVVVLGGLGSLFGPLLGALVVGPLALLLDSFANRPGHQPLPALEGFGLGLVLVLVVLLLPRGLAPVLARRFGSARANTSAAAPAPPDPSSRSRRR